MANSQQSTICFLVEQACEDYASSQDLSHQIIMFVRQNPNKDVRPVVDTIKKIIKSKKNDSPRKVLALKLLNDCLMQAKGNEELLVYVEKKILSRLTILAKTRKESTDVERGALMFGKNFNQKASADFLKLLLIYLQRWGNSLAGYTSSGKQTELSKVYQQLLKEKVAIPNEEEVLQQIDFNYNNPHSTPSVSQSLPVFNKDQFLSYQGQPQQHQRQKAQSNQQKQEAIKDVKYSQAQFRTSQEPPGKMPQEKTGREIQLEQARKVKDDYKKLNEYHQNSKLAEEILQLGGDSGGNLDEELLIQFRTQLTEGKQFSERFLKTLMDSNFQIKDKEAKIDKILMIINDISTQLENILIFKPYSPRTLKQMETKQTPEDDRMQRRNTEEIMTAPQDMPVSSQSKEETKQSSVKGGKSAKETVKDRYAYNMEDEQRPQQKTDDFNFEKAENDIFKTSFNFNPNLTQSLNTISWGQNSVAEFKAPQGDFNFNPIQSCFEPQLSQRKQDPKKEIKSPMMTQSMQIDTKSSSIGDDKSVVAKQSDGIKSKNKESQEEVKRVLIKDKVKSSHYANITLPSNQKPVLIQQVTEKPENTSDSPPSKSMSQLSSKIEVHKIQNKQGLGLKAFSSKPMITNESPDHAHISEDEENAQFQEGDEEDEEKSNFNFPTPSQKIINSQAFAQASAAQDFSWDFNNFGANSNSQQVYRKPEDSFQFPVKKQSSPSVTVFNESHKQEDQNSKVSSSNKSSSPEMLKVQQKQPSSKQEKQPTQLFDFNSLEENNDAQSSSPSPDAKNNNHQVQHLTAQLAELLEQVSNLRANLGEVRFQNDELKAKDKADRDHFKTMEKKMLDMASEITDLQEQARRAEKEALEKQVRIEELENQVKYYKKFEYMLEQEQFAKAQVSNEVADLQEKLEEYRKMADRLEHQVNKKEKEIQAVKEEHAKLEVEHSRVLQSHERDMQDLLESEGETKKQLQKEIFQARQNEEDARVQINILKEEARKKEDLLKKTYENDLRSLTDKEAHLQKRFHDEVYTRETKGRELDLLILQLQTQLADKEKELQAKTDEIEQTKSIMRPASIKYSGKELRSEEPKKESSLVTTPMNVDEKVNFQIAQKMRGDEKLNSEISSQCPLFDSMIKPQQRLHSDEAFSEPRVSNFENEELVEVLDYSPQKTVKATDADHLNDLTVIKEEGSNTMEQENQEINMAPSSESDMNDVDEEDEESNDDKKKQSGTEEQQNMNKYNLGIGDQLDKNQQDNLTKQELNSNDQVLQVESSPQKNDNECSGAAHKEDDIWNFFNKEETKQSSEKSNGTFDFTAVLNDAQEKLDNIDGKQEKSSLVQQENKGIDEIDRKSLEQTLDINVSQIKDNKSINHNVETPNFSYQSPIQNQMTEQKNQSPISQNLSQRQISVQSNKSPPKEDSDDFLAQLLQFSEKKQPQPQVLHQINNEYLIQRQTSQQEVKQQIQPQADVPQRQNSYDHSINQLQRSPLQSSSQKQLNEDLSQRRLSFNSHQQQQPSSSPQAINLIQTHQSQPQTPLTKQLQGPLTSQFSPLNQQNPTQLSPNVQQQNQQNQVQKQQSPQVNQGVSPQKQDITIDKSQFSTTSTEPYRQQQAVQQQQMMAKLDPQALIKQTLQAFFRKSLATSKAVIFEDSSLQIGMMSDFQPQQVLMRLFIGNKSTEPIQNIRIGLMQPLLGLKAQLSKEVIEKILPKTQDIIDVQVMTENTYQIGIPVYGLSYNGKQPMPLRLPIILLKFCFPLPLDAQQFIYKWNFEYSQKSEIKQVFNIDFNQCRSLTQLKEVLQIGRLTFNFVDGVEQLKNILCAATQFSVQLNGQNESLTALIKVVVTATGQGCEVIGRTNQEDNHLQPQQQKFLRFVIYNILELIALPMQNQNSQQQQHQQILPVN